MTDTGWIIVILVAVVAIILAFVLLRRKGAGEALSQAPVAEDMLPEQVALPVDGPEQEPEPGTSFPQEPLASIVPPVSENIATAPVPAHVASSQAAPDDNRPVDMASPVEPSPPVTPAATAPTPAPSPETVPALTPALTSEILPDTAEPITISTPPAPAMAAVVAAPSDGDDLLRLKGVGPKIVTLLHGQGITRYAQIAAWTDADLDAIDARLGNFAGRPRRDNWVDQATLLAAGDVPGYEAKYGKL